MPPGTKTLQNFNLSNHWNWTESLYLDIPTDRYLDCVVRLCLYIISFHSADSEENVLNDIYRVSYLWYSLITVTTAIAVGLIISAITGKYSRPCLI